MYGIGANSRNLSVLRRATVGLVVVLIGCSFGHDRDAAESAAARALVGAWDARFTRTNTVPGRSRAAGLVTVGGELAFVFGQRADGVLELPDPTNVGTFDVDFTPMGFEPREAGRVPVALARASGRDSVALLLGPGDDRPGVSMRGGWTGDSLVGTWSLVSTRVLGASGTFVMTRHRAGR